MCVRLFFIRMEMQFASLALTWLENGLIRMHWPMPMRRIQRAKCSRFFYFYFVEFWLIINFVYNKTGCGERVVFVSVRVLFHFFSLVCKCHKNNDEVISMWYDENGPKKKFFHSYKIIEMIHINRQTDKYASDVDHWGNGLTNLLIESTRSALWYRTWNNDNTRDSDNQMLKSTAASIGICTG